ncbi:hypothetical protein EPA93_44275 [Ktedonosporobacter rubrisoli]|uniref:Lantibiotic dehydratase n=1 Tax=Ktedonosporobacter rubrisoli TaxID=2509675 RepID=A0A4P6K3W2_KTERU|nr:lantibiotic dehydratase [Ktedonosporobacter rubrisoli]QBD82613.1 hypothetical protein EPA93_44275 [Ktedonosporobacter rubrisoli]
MAEETSPSISSYALYQPAAIYMLRTPVLPATRFQEITTNTSVAISTLAEDDVDATIDAQQQKCYSLLQTLAHSPELQLALEVASPALLASLNRSAGSEQKISPRTERSYASFLRYLIRMSTRPTPFGLFAGVAAGTFDTQTALILAVPTFHHIRTLPDMDWLLALIEEIEKSPAFLPQSRLRTNQTLYISGERIILPYADAYGRYDNRTISLSATSVVRRVLELARQEIAYVDLHARLLESFPQATSAHVDTLLQQLWEHRFLLSQLHPPLLEGSPLHYVAHVLAQLEGQGQLHTALEHIKQQLSAFDAKFHTPSRRSLHCLGESLKRLGSGAQLQFPLQIDAALQLKSSTLHTRIGEIAAYAGELLLRLSPQPRGPQHLQEYRAHFRARYGEHVDVPLLDLLSPENGLDAPDTYQHPLPCYQRRKFLAPESHSRRERILQTLLAEALHGGKQEIELTEALVRQLEQWRPALEEAPPSLEIYMQLQARSQSDLDQGKFAAIISRNCGSQAAGCTFGRFFDILDQKSRASLRSFARHEEACFQDAILVELTYQPRKARAANLTIRPALYEYEIAVGTTPSLPADRVIDLNDLVVGIRDNRFYLRSLRLAKQVIVRANHMLNIQSAPNLCRFLSEIGSDGTPCLQSFSWGALAHMPFLPRVVIKTSLTSTLVLCPAQWNLTQSTIAAAGNGSRKARQFRGLQIWRERWHVPRYVYFVESDRRLLLDLEHPILVNELFEEINSAADKVVILQEMLPDFQHLWLHDEQGAAYCSEIVVPLLRRGANISQQPSQRSPTLLKTSLTAHRPVIGQKDRSHYPGTRWSYLKWFVAHYQQDELIAGPIRTMAKNLREQGKIDMWFFIRYDDPYPHLRLRFHSKLDVDPYELLMTLLQWSQQLAQKGSIRSYCVDTYEQEIERYGGPDAMALAEQLFCIDSTIVSECLCALAMQQVSLDATALAVFLLDQFSTMWGVEPQLRLQWLDRYTDKYAFKAQFRPQRKWYCELLSASHLSNASNLGRQPADLLRLLEPHRSYVRSLTNELEHLSALDLLWGPLEPIWHSLNHMHCNRLLGINRQQEQLVYHFWRYTLESLLMRSKAQAEQERASH